MSYCLTEGNGHNCLLRDQTVAAHVLATSGAQPRLVVAFPAGNSGAAFWARASDGSPAQLRVKGPVTSFRRGRERGIRFTLTSDKPLRVSRVLTGSIRTIRSYHHLRKMDFYQGVIQRATKQLAALDPAARAQAEAAGVTAATLKERSQVELTREATDPPRLLARKTSLCGTQQVTLRLTGQAGGELQLSGQQLRLGQAGPLRLLVEATTTHPLMEGLGAAQLLRPVARDHLARLARDPAHQQRHARLAEALRSLEFLSSRRKFMAGSWRFLTYFGRDTLMSLWLLRPALTPEALEAGLQSVLDNLSPEGMVGHEESLGDQASLERLERFASLAARGEVQPALHQLRRISAPVMAYHMVDDDLMLALLMAAYLDDPGVSRERAAAFWSRKARGGQSNLQALARNLDYLLGRAAPYGASGKATDLVPLHQGLQVGDWRDSNTGLGGGRYAASVNAYLMPAALAALDRMLASGALDLTALTALAGEHGLARLGAPDLPARIRALRSRWELAYQHFEVKLAPAQLRQRLATFLATVPAAEQALLRGQDLGGGITAGQLERGEALPPAVKEAGLTFHAVALNADGAPVQVMHTDDGFAWLGLDLPLALLERLLVKYELAYPLGLRDQHGVYVANPALSARAADFATFDRGQYHGTVVWAWQQALLQRGLMHQLARCRQRKGPRAARLAARITRVLEQIAATERRVGALAASELWTVKVVEGKFAATPYGHGSGHATESNALQLWSNVSLAVDLERTRLGLAQAPSP